jgi:3-oxoadipate enol-lactonase
VTTAERLAASGDVRIAYEVLGSGPALVLAHGLGYARWGWEPVAGPLADDFSVILFDNRGIGASEIPPGPYSARAMAEDLVAVLDDAGCERAHIVGTSLGGMVAQEVALGWPERLDRLVLACTTPGGPHAFPLPKATVHLLLEAPSLPPEQALRRFVENALALETPVTRPELLEHIVARRLESPPNPAGWHAQAAAGTSFDALDRIDSIGAPTLVLHGTADRVVDPRNAPLLAERIPGARLELLPGAGHLFFWEQPEWFLRHVREFLDGR